MEGSGFRRPRLYIEVDDLLPVLAGLHAEGKVSRQALARIVSSVYDLAIGAAHVRAGRPQHGERDDAGQAYGGETPPAGFGRDFDLDHEIYDDQTGHRRERSWGSGRNARRSQDGHYADSHWHHAAGPESVGAPERPSSVLRGSMAASQHSGMDEFGRFQQSRHFPPRPTEFGDDQSSRMLEQPAPVKRGLSAAERARRAAPLGSSKPASASGSNDLLAQLLEHDRRRRRVAAKRGGSASVASVPRPSRSGVRPPALPGALHPATATAIVAAAPSSLTSSSANLPRDFDISASRTYQSDAHLRIARGRQMPQTAADLVARHNLVILPTASSDSSVVGAGEITNGEEVDVDDDGHVLDSASVVSRASRAATSGAPAVLAPPDSSSSSHGEGQSQQDLYQEEEQDDDTDESDHSPRGGDDDDAAAGSTTDHIHHSNKRQAISSRLSVAAQLGPEDEAARQEEEEEEEEDDDDDNHNQEVESDSEAESAAADQSTNGLKEVAAKGRDGKIGISSRLRRHHDQSRGSKHAFDESGLGFGVAGRGTRRQHRTMLSSASSQAASVGAPDATGLPGDGVVGMEIGAGADDGSTPGHKHQSGGDIETADGADREGGSATSRSSSASVQVERIDDPDAVVTAPGGTALHPDSASSTAAIPDPEGMPLQQDGLAGLAIVLETDAESAGNGSPSSATGGTSRGVVGSAASRMSLLSGHSGQPGGTDSGIGGALVGTQRSLAGESTEAASVAGVRRAYVVQRAQGHREAVTEAAKRQEQESNGEPDQDSSSGNGGSASPSTLAVVAGAPGESSLSDTSPIAAHSSATQDSANGTDIEQSQARLPVSGLSAKSLTGSASATSALSTATNAAVRGDDDMMEELDDDHDDGHDDQDQDDHQDNDPMHEADDDDSHDGLTMASESGRLDSSRPPSLGTDRAADAGSSTGMPGDRSSHLGIMASAAGDPGRGDARHDVSALPYARSVTGHDGHDDDDHGSHVEIASVEVRPPSPSDLSGTPSLGGIMSNLGSDAGESSAVPDMPERRPSPMQPPNKRSTTKTLNEAVGVSTGDGKGSRVGNGEKPSPLLVATSGSAHDGDHLAQTGADEHSDDDDDEEEADEDEDDDVRSTAAVTGRSRGLGALGGQDDHGSTGQHLSSSASVAPVEYAAGGGGNSRVPLPALPSGDGFIRSAKGSVMGSAASAGSYRDADDEEERAIDVCATTRAVQKPLAASTGTTVHDVTAASGVAAGIRHPSASEESVNGDDQEDTVSSADGGEDEVEFPDTSDDDDDDEEEDDDDDQEQDESSDDDGNDGEAGSRIQYDNGETGVKPDLHKSSLMSQLDVTASDWTPGEAGGLQFDDAVIAVGISAEQQSAERSSVLRVPSAQRHLQQQEDGDAESDGAGAASTRVVVSGGRRSGRRRRRGGNNRVQFDLTLQGPVSSMPHVRTSTDADESHKATDAALGSLPASATTQTIAQAAGTSLLSGSAGSGALRQLTPGSGSTNKRPSTKHRFGWQPASSGQATSAAVLARARDTGEAAAMEALLDAEADAGDDDDADAPQSPTSDTLMGAAEAARRSGAVRGRRAESRRSRGWQSTAFAPSAAGAADLVVEDFEAEQDEQVQAHSSRRQHTKAGAARHHGRSSGHGSRFPVGRATSPISMPMGSEPARHATAPVTPVQLTPPHASRISAAANSRPMTASGSRARRHEQPVGLVDVDDSTDDLVRLPLPWGPHSETVRSRPIPSSRLQRALHHPLQGGMSTAERDRLQEELDEEIPDIDE